MFCEPGSAQLLVSVGGYVCDDEYNTVQDNINSPMPDHMVAMLPNVC